MLSFGADDAHDYLGGVPAGRTIGNLGSPSWSAEYRRRLEGVTRELNAAGMYVVWIGLPIPAGQGFSRSFPVVNRLLRSVAARHRHGAMYIDTWHMLDSAQGKYTDYLRNAHGKVVLLRARDGVHYLPAAGDMVAQAILQQLIYYDTPVHPVSVPFVLATPRRRLLTPCHVVTRRPSAA